MTEISFYTRVGHRLQFAARLAAKAYAQGRRVRLLTQDAGMNAELDLLLWTQNPTGFSPHCRLSHRLAPQTPIIVDDQLEHQGEADLLINLHEAPPPFFSRFERLAEIVSEGGEDVHAGRRRWRFYSERGYPLQTHDMNGRA